MALAWSAYQPKEYFTWFLEILPVLIAWPVLYYSRKKFPLTDLSYAFVTLHFLVLIIGGKYTYAEVPLFSWVRDAFGHSRNNYDKIGHFMQGFVPALLCMEIFTRKKVINGERWQFFLITCTCLGFSAFYELIEWWVSALTEDGSDAFLGTQGYVWDTQSDMLLALCGAVLAQVLLSKVLAKQLNEPS